MGFFSKLFKKLEQKVVNQQQQQGYQNFNNNQAFNNAGYRPQPQATCKSHFDEIFASEFSGYEVKQGVATDEIVPASAGLGFRPYSYVFYDNGMAKLAVMITPRFGHESNEFLGAKTACETAGIPFVNFFLHMPNERNYVINRLKQYI
jgi:hypothetical protein